MLKQLFSGLLSSTESLAISDLEQVLKEKDTVLLDVREKDEYMNGHHPLAVNHPLSQIEDFKESKEKQYLVICQSGMRSQRATTYLTSQGYRAVNVQGGMNAWRGAILRGGAK